MTFAVRYSASARDDLKRLYEYLLDHTHAGETEHSRKRLVLTRR